MSGVKKKAVTTDRINLSRIDEIDEASLRVVVKAMIVVSERHAQRIKELEIEAKRAYQRGYTAGKLSAIRRWTQRTSAGSGGNNSTE